MGDSMTKEDLIAFEADLAEEWGKGNIKCPLHLSGGNEDQLIEIFERIGKDDYVFATHRNHYHYLLHTGNIAGLRSEVLGDKNGICKGNGRSMAVADYVHNFFSSAIVGGMCAPAVGVGWTLKRNGDSRRVWCFVGDGVLDGGHFWEALQYAEGWDLPVTFIIEHNNRSTCTSVKERLGDKRSCRDLLMFSEKVEIYDYEAVWAHVGTGEYVQF